MQARLALTDCMGLSETALALRHFDRLRVPYSAAMARSAQPCMTPRSCDFLRLPEPRQIVAGCATVLCVVSRYKVVKADERDVPLGRGCSGGWWRSSPLPRRPCGFPSALPQ